MRRSLAVWLSSLVLLAGCAGGAGPTTPGDNGSQPVPPVTQEPQPTPPTPAEPQVYDLVIKGGTIVDGSGAVGYLGDVAIVGDRIVAVGQLGPYSAEREIDAAGKVVAPGFINPHSHTHDYINPFDDYDTIASLMQGITTEIGGVDGRAPLPVADELARIEQIGTGVNFGTFAGQNNIREWVMGKERGAPTQAQLEQMESLVRASMEAGAFGLSTGLEYQVGPFTTTEELIALNKVVAEYGGVYSTHMRSEGARLVEAVEEAIRIGREAGIPVNISHLKVVGYPNWGKEEQVIRLIDQAIAQGQTVFADIYPYESPDFGINRTLDVGLGFMPPEYLVVTSAFNSAHVGKTVAQVAQDLGVARDAIASELADAGLRVVALLNSEQAMVRFYQQPWAIVSTDGEAQPKLDDPGQALALALHRRSYGSYPKLLGHYVREQKIMPLETMIHKMSGGVADRLGVAERGYLKPGYFADIVVFDPATIADNTTWLLPQEYPSGIHWVLVNGIVAVEDGQPAGGRPGRVLRFGH